MLAAVYRLFNEPNSEQLLHKMLQIGCELNELSYNDEEIPLAVQINNPVIAACGLIKKEFDHSEFNDEELEYLLKIVKGNE